MNKFAEKCTRCNLCVKQCAFLQKYGNPGDIAAAFNLFQGYSPGLPFECSLCELCASVCPSGLNPAEIFLEMRREVVHRCGFDFSKYKALLDYERRGMSKRYSLYALPSKCDTVFFPGCTLPGTRPKQTFRLFNYLKGHIPTIGVVLDCCSKPSHDLGRQQSFNKNFGELKRFLEEKCIKKVLAACPSCREIFSKYGGSIQVETVYEIMSQKGLPISQNVSGAVCIHDPCVARRDEKVYHAIRLLVKSAGLDVMELEHSGKNTLCCGEGGAVRFINPQLAASWTCLRAKEAGSQKVITYCAGCSAILSRSISVCHMIDLVFEPHAALSGRAKVYRAPITYLNRMLLKRWFKKAIVTAVRWERDVKDDY